MVRQARPHPLRFVAALAAGVLVLLAALAGMAAPGRFVPPGQPGGFYIARADTDSVHVARPASDTTIALPDTGLAARYLPRWRRDRPSASLFPRSRSPLSLGPSRIWQHRIALDSTEQAYVIREQVAGQDVRHPVVLDLAAYRRARLRHDLSRNWRELYDQRARQRNRSQRSGLGISVVVPGGRESAFTTIFGKNELDLRVNGQADIRAGFDYRKSDQQVAITGRASQLDPDFKQDLRLGINGTIGDKLRIDVNYDSNSQFDFQNQIKLEYTGYEDEIIRKIEAGNVFLQTPSSLIRGGQSLFGIKSEFQIGGLYLTTVMSQQEGQANSLSISGGSETTNFDLKPTDYEDETHFFLAYYFRNRWEDALSDPPNLRVANGFERIAEIEVWKLQPTTPEEENVRQAVAVVDLAEDPRLLTEANAYTATVLPDPALDQYDDTPGGELDTQLRDGNAAPASYLEDVKGLTGADFQVGRFKKLERGRDYTLDEVLGFISLRQRLLENEALAVSFRYIANGRSVQVGDFSTGTGGSGGGQNEDKLVLKLLRPVQLRQPAPETGFNPAVWYLQLRNIYRFPGSGINPNEFNLQIFYEPPGKTASKTLPGVGGQATLLQLLGLDRLNTDQAPRPDDQFDYLVNYTIDPGNGRLIFPFLEPFGGRLERLIEQGGGSEQEKQEARNLFVFSSLYRQKKENARRDTQHDVYRIRGSYRGAVQAFYDLRAYAGLVPGSVRVTSGGTPLNEGTDFVVDYQGGTLTITNPAYLTAGRDINIEYEQNSFFNLQKKTLLGLRADYSLNENFGLGATVMRLSQKSPIDKYRIGEEPIQNTIWGVDGTLRLEPRWLTRAIDLLPLVQTRAPSAISVTGEFAQLRPGSNETLAFERTRRNLRNAGRDFNGDELRGISYIDDFEGFENTFSLKQPGAWQLASPPDSIGAIDRDGVVPGTRADSLRTTWRGSFGWYTINANMFSQLNGVPVYDLEAVDIVQIRDVFPNRDTRAEIDQTLQTLDLYFNPSERGPYNYTTDLQGFLDNPKNAWGGMAQRLPEGFTDFSLKNIDFVEFIIRPFPENPTGDAGRDAKLYVDLGSISEDILPDEKLNNEDGLSLSDFNPAAVGPWGRTPNGSQNSAVDIDDASRRTEDLGLDGLPSYVTDGTYSKTEQEHFRHFLDAITAVSGDARYQAEVAKALADPSGDDYHYFANDRFFDDPTFFPNRATFQQRFTRWFAGHELNAFETQNQLANNTSIKRGNSRYPDSEDRNLNSAIDTENSYFQYEVPLSKAILDSLAAPERVNDFVVGEIVDTQTGRRTGWYQIRIPVQNYTRRVGDIRDFSLIESIRIWTTGHEVPITIRFATLELVGSQWQKSEQVTLERETPADTTASPTRTTISSINNEENSLYRPPLGAIVSQTRLATGGTQNAREQSLVFRVEHLRPGQQRAIFRTYNQGLDLLKYANLRMFVHMHGRTADGVDLTALPKEEARRKVRLFVRLGANQTNDYYEYEQPLTPSSETAGDEDELWQTNREFDGRILDLNSMNLVLGALNQLKVARDRLGVPTEEVFWNVRGDSLVAPDVPDAEAFAPPGTRLAIRGNPSLGRINTIVIGLRNPADSTSNALEDILEDVTIWVNELRVSGYDEQNGWAALVNADVKLADFGRVKANFQTRTDGFGSLSSTLGERDQVDLTNWSLLTEVNADKLLPERYGWSIPVSLQIQSNRTRPRFSPTRGDVRLDEILAQIEERDDLDPAQKALEKQRAIEAAETRSFTRSFTTRFGKQGSRSGLLRYTLDGLALTYAYSDTDARSPSLRLNDTWRWSSTLSYRLNVPRPKTVRPFWFLDELPLLGLLGDLRFNYLPQSLSASGTATRSFSQTQDRPREGDLLAEDALPEPVAFPLREQHAFTHSRNFQLQYNPFGFLNLSFDMSTNQSLNAVGVDTLFSVVTRDSTGTVETFEGLNLDEALAQGLIEAEDIGRNAFELARLRVRPADEVFAKFFKGADGVRTERHEQRFSATFRPQLSRSGVLSWINLQDVVYSAQFGWQNGPVGRNTGAAVSNQFDVRGGVTLRLQDFWRKFAFYRALEEAERQAQAEKERRRREAERRRAEQLKPKPETEQGEAGQEDQAEEKEDDEGGGLKVPLPDPVSLMRKLVLAVTGVRDLTLTYSGTRSARSSNVGRFNADSTGVLSPWSLFDAFRGNGPSLGYRFGLERTLPLENRLIDPTLQVADQFDNTNRIQGRTALNPSPSLQINLNWSVDWNQGRTLTYRRPPDDPGRIEITETESGSNRASVWTFGASYLDLFRRQLETYQRDLAHQPDPANPLLGDEDGNGRVVLTNQSVAEDFRSAFTTGLGPLDDQGLLPFPMPGWNVNYSGLSKWPLLRSLTQSLTLRHGYSADYSADYRTNTLAAGGDSLGTFDLGTRRIQFTLPLTEAGTIRINERFQPLIGLDISWKGRIQTNIAFNTSNAFSLSTSNFEVSQNETRELSVTASFQKTGLKIPLLGGKRLNNRISFSLTVSRSQTSNQRFLLRRALIDAATRGSEFVLEDALKDPNVSLITDHTRLVISPQISYQFSNRVSANFTLRYEQFDSKDSRQPSATNIQGNFNIRVNIQN
ncbi:cell surface protein SprA [Rhodocaloribacter litoris]|uniref:T9SS outer membrane translocon Sov/SprA n=1 Tax=Rhodocaloribacter litoris TaxID=2558931 RepID=UPI001E4C1305|nr:cell surface protein SprA [Rhodocaloribacter litoris]